VDAKAKPAVDAQKKVLPDAPDGRIFLVLSCFALSGLCSLVYQVAWTRIFSLLLGSSVYAFSLILTIFILGLAVGTAVFARWVHRLAEPLAVFGFLQAGIGLSALAGVPFFGEIPFLHRWVYRNWGAEFVTLQGVNLLIIFSFLFIPTVLMGAQFPVVIRLTARRLETLGRHVGEAYAANTLGTIAGAFLGGFIFIPFFGVQNTLLCMVMVNVILGAVLIGGCAGVSATIRYYGLPAVVIAAVWAAHSVQPWDKAVISSGAYMPYRIEDLNQAVLRKNKILFYKEGLHTTVTAELANTGNIFLRVNGKTDASLALDMRTQLLSGYLPMFFHPAPKSVLVVGQGSGITLGAVEQFPVRNVDLVEISGEVIEGSRFFSPFNHRALDDSRLRVILEDGRNHISLTDARYDVIISEPSNPWISGVGALFTRDFFELARRRLNPGGILCIWIHTNLSPLSFKSVVKTFTSLFPHATLWESIVGDDYLLVGSEQAYALPYEKVERVLAQEASGKDLRRIGIHNVRDLMSLMMMDRAGLERFSADAPIHTDDNSLLEFSAPQYIYKDERSVIVRQLEPFVHVDPGLVRFEESADGQREEVRELLRTVARSESQVAEIKRHARIDTLLDRAALAFQNGDPAGALATYTEILRLDPEHVLTYANIGSVFTALKRYDAAESAYKKTIAINPFYLFGYLDLARLYITSGQPAAAESLLRPVLDWHPSDREVRLVLGLAYSLQKAEDKAVAEWTQALALEPNYDLAHYYLGVQYRNSRPDLSRRHLQRFLALRGSVTDQLTANAHKLLKNL
jgi:spermidine synthase